MSHSYGDLAAVLVFEHEQKLAGLFVIVALNELLEAYEREGVIDGNAAILGRLNLLYGLPYDAKSDDTIRIPVQMA